MVSALSWANENADAKSLPGPRYDLQYEWTEGGHTDKAAGARMEQILRWVMRDF
jgi:hypothetical protein